MHVTIMTSHMTGHDRDEADCLILGKCVSVLYSSLDEKLPVVEQCLVFVGVSITKWLSGLATFLFLSFIVIRDTKLMDEKTTAKELDSWIARLEECKQLEEKQVRILCNKVAKVVLHTIAVAFIV